MRLLLLVVLAVLEVKPFRQSLKTRQQKIQIPMKITIPETVEDLKLGESKERNAHFAHDRMMPK